MRPFPPTETYKKGLQFCFMILNSHRTHPCCVCVSSYDTGARSLLRTPAMLLFCLPTHVINNSSNKSLIPRTVSLSGPLTFQTPNLSDKFNTNQAMYIRRSVGSRPHICCCKMALTSCVLSGKQIICACAKGSSPLHVLCLPCDDNSANGLQPIRERHVLGGG